MKSLIRIIAVVAFTFSLFSPAIALASLEHVAFIEIPNLGNPGNEKDYLEAFWSGGVDLTYLQKWDTDGTGFDQNPGIGTYTFDPDGNVPKMEITWDLTATAYDLAFVFVKGGNARGGNKYYNLYTVTAGKMKDSITAQEIILEATERKDISHISFFGVPSTDVVPEPGTIAVWGLLAVTGYFGMKKYQAKA
jgi:hypothetical protein